EERLVILRPWKAVAFIGPREKGDGSFVVGGGGGEILMRRIVHLRDQSEVARRAQYGGLESGPGERGGEGGRFARGLLSDRRRAALRRLEMVEHVERAGIAAAFGDAERI